MFETRAVRSGTTATLHVSGEVDTATAPDLGAAIEALVGVGPRTVVVDLADVSFIDSRGLGVLVGVRADLPADVDLIVGRASPRTARTFERMHLAELFVFEPPLQR